MLLTITNEQKITVTLNPTTLAGNPATLDGAPVWEALGDGDATIEVAPDGLSATLISGEANINSTFRVTADGVPGEEVGVLTEDITLAVVPASASSLGLVAGAAELK